ncbi:MAG: ABC transporter ATP-binding protein [Rhodospirillales bacterium]|nr:ABC transporter ATP-binding protein [Rhodospirillales bacterium]
MADPEIALTGDILTITKLVKRFGDFTAVDGIDLSVRPGEILALLGPSGCGKTTTLRMVSGLERPTGGEIVFQDQVFASVASRQYLPPEKRNIGMVFQSYALWPHMTVFQNVGYPLKLRRENSATIRDKVENVLALMELSNLVDRTIPELSGGQQQRVALARALVYEPSLMLFDEPFSNLDAQLRSQMRHELKALRRKIKMTGIFVTHDQVEALSLADRVAIMRHGRIEQLGTPHEVYSRPATRFVRDFLSRVVNLHGVVTEIGADGDVTVRLDGEANKPLTVSDYSAATVKPGDRAQISIRPEHIEILPEHEANGAANMISGKIEDILFVGDRFETRIRIGGETVVIDLPSDGTWQDGQTLSLRFGQEATTLWPEGP